jgi:hypothetical protein
MNRITPILFIVIASFTIQAQEEPIQVEIVKDSSYEFVDPFGKQELRLNMLDLLSGPALHVFYERVVDASNSYGVSTFLDLSDNNSSYQNFSVNPYYRFYFLNRKDFGAQGMFVEIFSSLASVQSDVYGSDKNEFQVSLGMSLGRKWINKSGFTFETFLGMGRYLLDSEDLNEVHGRIGIAVGKRF